MMMRQRFRRRSLLILIMFYDQLLLTNATYLQNIEGETHVKSRMTVRRDTHPDRARIATSTSGERETETVGTHILMKRSKDSCHAEYSAETGALMLPNYPQRYKENTRCKWLITVPKGYFVMLKFFDMDIPSLDTYYCSKDYAMIREGGIGSTSLGQVCGTAIPDPVISKGNSLAISFRSVGDMQGKGFHAEWSAVFLPCQPGWVLSKFKEGVTVSCLKTFSFGSEDDSSYSLAVENCVRQESHLVTITTKQQDTRVNAAIPMNKKYYIGLKKDTTNRWTWITTEPYVYTQKDLPGRGDNGNCVYISVRRLLFTLWYSWNSTSCSNVLVDGYVCEQDISVTGQCGDTYNSTNGTIMSPNYPQNYNTRETCEWIITTTENHILQLIFTHMDIANSTNCRLDRLMVRARDHGSLYVLGTFCGNEIPDPVETTWASAWIQFVSTNLLPGTGFKIHWNSEMNKCGGDWKGRLVIHAKEQSCYRAFFFKADDEKSHSNAVHNCILHRSHLVTITDEAENQYLGRAVGVGSFYIGLQKDHMQNEWAWTTGESFNFTEWSEEDLMENDCSYVENMVVILGDPYMRWHDINCTSTDLILGYICEKLSTDYCTYLDENHYKEGDQWNVDCDLTCECQDGMTNIYDCQQMCVSEEIDVKHCELVMNADNQCCTQSWCDYTTTGSDFPMARETSDLKTATSSRSYSEVILFAVIPVLAAVGIASACGIIYRRRLRRRHGKSGRQHGGRHYQTSCFCVDTLRDNNDAKKDALVLSNILKTILNDNVQIQLESLLLAPNSVHIGEQLGKGAFGTVFKGRYENSDYKQTVAIKTLADNCIGSEISAFVSEAITMSELAHNHVLSIVGVCINLNTEAPMIVLPFMEHGDLKTYLRQFRYEQADLEPPDEIQLLIFCLHIARGMSYLSNLKFVHRDLAARNCMLDSNLVVKVADFGLTRDIYSETYYRQDQQKLLPVKWMSLESLRDHVFTVYSDIWSYGVTAWEVMSQGKVPYSELDNSVILRHLETGGRLPQPNIGPDFMYLLMMDCWNEKIEKRPAFNQISECIADYLAEKCDYLDLNTEADSAITMATNNMPQEDVACSIPVTGDDTVEHAAD